MSTKRDDDGMSINERQAARADAAARPAEAPPVEPAKPSDTLAGYALALANEQGEAADVTVERARQYHAFLKENRNDG